MNVKRVQPLNVRRGRHGRVRVRRRWRQRRPQVVGGGGGHHRARDEKMQQGKGEGEGEEGGAGEMKGQRVCNGRDGHKVEEDGDKRGVWGERRGQETSAAALVRRRSRTHESSRKRAGRGVMWPRVSKAAPRCLIRCRQDCGEMTETLRNISRSRQEPSLLATSHALLPFTSRLPIQTGPNDVHDTAPPVRVAPPPRPPPADQNSQTHPPWRPHPPPARAAVATYRPVPIAPWSAGGTWPSATPATAQAPGAPSARAQSPCPSPRSCPAAARTRAGATRSG